jgi:hypothetical protein
LSYLSTRLASPDPSTQETALAPSVRARGGQPPGILPPGSTVTPDLTSWKLGRTRDPFGLQSATVRTKLTRPGQPQTTYELHLLKVGSEWLIYDSGPA